MLPRAGFNNEDQRDEVLPQPAATTTINGRNAASMGCNNYDTVHEVQYNGLELQLLNQREGLPMGPNNNAETEQGLGYLSVRYFEYSKK